MRRLLVVVVYLLTVVAATAAPVLPRPAAKWTFMVYMSADGDDLDPNAVLDLAEMTRYGKVLKSLYKKKYDPEAANVHVVVQADRTGSTPGDSTVKNWSGAKRFWVHPKLEEISDLGPTDMGDGDTLRLFVEWARENFPADRYALVIWCHGQGWRKIEVEVNPCSTAETVVAASTRKLLVPIGVTSASFAGGAHDPGAKNKDAKAGSSDDGDILYNAEAVKAVTAAFAGRELELLAYDSCLMGMIETAHAWSDAAHTFVASEELVPGYGFHFDTLLAALENDPAVSPADLGRIMVADYGRGYDRAGAKENTMAAISLSQIKGLSAAVSALADELILKLHASKAAVAKARSECQHYGQGNVHGDTFHHVDLKRFCDLLATHSVDPVVRQKAMHISDLLVKAVDGRRYAGSKRKDGAYGSHGLAIYFPPSRQDYEGDMLNDGSYDQIQARKRPWPVAFVADTSWSRFLLSYFGVMP